MTVLIDFHPFSVEAFEGNTLILRFALRNESTGLPLDVRSATSIRLEWEMDGVVKTPVESDRLHPLADWSRGIVIVEVGPGNVTLETGVAHATLTALWSSVSYSFCVGVIDVQDRPGWPPTP